MANLYGVANPNPLPVSAFTIGAINISCPAGVETNCCSIAANPTLSQGVYYPFVVGQLFVTLGATAPGALTVGARIGAGADFDQAGFTVVLLVAAGTIEWTVNLFGVGTILSYPTGALTLNVTLNPTGQPVTCLAGGTKVWGGFNRAPDQ